MKGIKIMKKSTIETYDSSFYLSVLSVKSQVKDKEWIETAWKLKDPIKRLRHMAK